MHQHEVILCRQDDVDLNAAQGGHIQGGDQRRVRQEVRGHDADRFPGRGQGDAIFRRDETGPEPIAIDPGLQHHEPPPDLVGPQVQVIVLRPGRVVVAAKPVDDLAAKMAEEKQQLMSTYQAGALPKPETPSFSNTELA